MEIRKKLLEVLTASLIGVVSFVTGCAFDGYSTGQYGTYNTGYGTYNRGFYFDPCNQPHFKAIDIPDYSRFGQPEFVPQLPDYNFYPPQRFDIPRFEPIVPQRFDIPRFP